MSKRVRVRYTDVKACGVRCRAACALPILNALPNIPFLQPALILNALVNIPFQWL
jgi:hypothetical protein